MYCKKIANVVASQNIYGYSQTRQASWCIRRIAEISIAREIDRHAAPPRLLGGESPKFRSLRYQPLHLMSYLSSHQDASHLYTMSGEIRRKLVIVGEYGDVVKGEEAYACRRRCLREDMPVCLRMWFALTISLIVFSKGMFPEVSECPFHR